MNTIKLQVRKSIYKNQLHFSTQAMNYQQEKLMKESITVALKRIKYLAINLNKEINDFHTENYTLLGGGGDEDIKKWKEPSLMDWKNQYHRCNANPSQNSNGNFHGNRT